MQLLADWYGLQNVSRFYDLVKELPEIKAVIIRMDRIPYVDQTGLYVIEDTGQDIQGQVIIVTLTVFQGQPEEMLKNIQLVQGLIPKKYCFQTFEECMVWLESYLKTTITHLVEQVKETVENIFFTNHLLC